MCSEEDEDEEDEDEDEDEPQPAAVSVQRRNIWKLPERRNAASWTSGQRSDTLGSTGFCWVLLLLCSL